MSSTLVFFLSREISFMVRGWLTRVRNSYLRRPPSTHTHSKSRSCTLLRLQIYRRRPYTIDNDNIREGVEIAKVFDDEDYTVEVDRFHVEDGL